MIKLFQQDEDKSAEKHADRARRKPATLPQKTSSSMLQDNNPTYSSMTKNKNFMNSTLSSKNKFRAKPHPSKHQGSHLGQTRSGLKTPSRKPKNSQEPAAPSRNVRRGTDIKASDTKKLEPILTANEIIKSAANEKTKGVAEENKYSEEQKEKPSTDVKAQNESRRYEDVSKPESEGDMFSRTESLLSNPGEAKASSGKPSTAQSSYPFKVPDMEISREDLAISKQLIQRPIG